MPKPKKNKKLVKRRQRKRRIRQLKNPSTTKKLQGKHFPGPPLTKVEKEEKRKRNRAALKKAREDCKKSYPKDDSPQVVEKCREACGKTEGLCKAQTGQEKTCYCEAGCSFRKRMENAASESVTQEEAEDLGLHMCNCIRCPDSCLGCRETVKKYWPEMFEATET